MTVGLGRLLFALWAVSAVVCGSVFTSFHQPFRAPQPAILALTHTPADNHWRAVHFVSSSCACSQRILQGLERRGKLSDVSEQIIVINSHETPLPGFRQLLQQLEGQGFHVEQLDSNNIPANIGLHGVPMLAIASPAGKLVYTGGYGQASGADSTLIRRTIAGSPPSPKPIIGCAVGERIRRSADPLGWKY